MSEEIEQLKASIRAKIVHPFHVIKDEFRHRMAWYQGLPKIQADLFGQANMLIAQRALMTIHTRGAT